MVWLVFLSSNWIQSADEADAWWCYEDAKRLLSLLVVSPTRLFFSAILVRHHERHHGGKIWCLSVTQRPV